MFDVSESGRQIGEKLFTFLDPKQKQELERYVSEQGSCNSGLFRNGSNIHAESCMQESECPLTEIWEGELYFCLEQRMVEVSGQEIMLTATEFDLLAVVSKKWCAINITPRHYFFLILESVWNGLLI